MNTHSRTVAVVVAALLFGACGKQPASTEGGTQVQEPVKEPTPADDTVQLTPTQDDSTDRTAAAQNRIAGAFYSSIVPNLASCWNQVSGKGAVQFKYTYDREGDNWVFRQIEADGNSLEKGQDAAAMQCMQQAVRGSKFPVESDEAAHGSKEMVIHWSWPVPLPEDTTQLARMIVENPGGECPRLCQDCAWRPGRSFCASACSGWTGCVEDGTGSGCKMTRPECRTGWSGSFAGVFMAREAGDAPAPGEQGDGRREDALVADSTPR